MTQAVVATTSAWSQSRRAAPSQFLATAKKSGHKAVGATNKWLHNDQLKTSKQTTHRHAQVGPEPFETN